MVAAIVLSMTGLEATATLRMRVRTSADIYRTSSRLSIISISRYIVSALVLSMTHRAEK
jgi:hypothetical protein